jgi:DNA polymerase-4
MHVAMDALYAAVHQREDQRLSGRPVAVVRPSSPAVVLGVSCEAHWLGIRAAQPLSDAICRCPELVVIKASHSKYREASRQVLTILRRFTSPELIESVALDEAYLDVTARTRHGTSSPEDVARRIKYAISTEIGLTASIGVATSKSVAKIAGSIRRPDGLVMVPPGTEEEFLAPLPIEMIPGLEQQVQEQLSLVGIRTVGDLARHETQRLIQILGPSGGLLQRLAQGRDRSPVVGLKPAQTFSAETTFETALVDAVQIDEALQRLVGRIAQRLAAKGVRARTVAVKVKLPDQGTVNRQFSRTAPTDSEEAILRTARAALQHFHLGSRPIRLLGVAVSGLQRSETDVQLMLFNGLATEGARR